MTLWAAQRSGAAVRFGKARREGLSLCNPAYSNPLCKQPGTVCHTRGSKNENQNNVAPFPYANNDSAGISRCLRSERIISIVSFRFLLRTSEARLLPPRYFLLAAESSRQGLSCKTVACLRGETPLLQPAIRQDETLAHRRQEFGSGSRA